MSVFTGPMVSQICIDLLFLGGLTSLFPYIWGEMFNLSLPGFLVQELIILTRASEFQFQVLGDDLIDLIIVKFTPVPLDISSYHGFILSSFLT